MFPAGRIVDSIGLVAGERQRAPGEGSHFIRAERAYRKATGDDRARGGQTEGGDGQPTATVASAGARHPHLQ
jgi:hypothetical protein